MLTENLTQKLLGEMMNTKKASVCLKAIRARFLER